MRQYKQYLAPRTDVFNLGPNVRLMQDFPLGASPSMHNPGQGAPMRHPLEWL